MDIANGMSIKAVAEKYQVADTTVKKELRWAEREGFFEKAEDAIAHRLIPLALDVYERALRKHLETGDYDAAERLLRGVRLFNPNGDRTAAANAANAARTAEEADEVTWERFTARRAQRLNEVVDEDVAPASAPAAPGERNPGNPDRDSAVDAEILGPGDREDRAAGTNSEAQD